MNPNNKKKPFAVTGLAITLMLQMVTVRAQGTGPADIQNQLSALYQTAKATADGTDIVTAGSVLVLQKDHLLMNKVEQPFPVLNLYKNGAISQGGLRGVLGALSGGLSKLGQAGGQQADAPAAPDRQFVTGEKFWVTQIVTKSDGVYYSLMSDPIKDQRYKATLEFPFPRGTTPTADDVTALVSRSPEDRGTGPGGARAAGPGPAGGPDQDNRNRPVAG